MYKDHIVNQAAAQIEVCREKKSEYIKQFNRAVNRAVKAKESKDKRKELYDDLLSSNLIALGMWIEFAGEAGFISLVLPEGVFGPSGLVDYTINKNQEEQLRIASHRLYKARVKLRKCRDSGDADKVLEAIRKLDKAQEDIKDLLYLRRNWLL